MIMVPGQYPGNNPTGGQMTWWEEILYVIGVSSFFIGSLVFWVWLYFEFFY